MLKLSEIMKTGAVAGVRGGSTYEQVVAALGEGSQLCGEPYPGHSYGDLEIHYEKRDGLLIAVLVYLNSNRSRIRVKSAIPFDNEGLSWGVTAKTLCGWLISRDVPFSFAPPSISPDDHIDILLTGSRPCVVGIEYGLSEIYISLAPSAP